MFSEDAFTGYKENTMNGKEDAIVLSDRGKIIQKHSYKDVYETRDLIKKFLLQNISEQFICVVLPATHNIYIPSIILSLEELQFAFIFLTNEEIDNGKVLQQLGINWVLKYKATESTLNIPSLLLQNEEIFLERQDNTLQCYKDIFYVIKTSGTTGIPKFVKVGRRCINSNIESLTSIFNITKSDVIYFGTPLTFDPSMVELLLALRNKACLLITTPRNQINPLYLYETLFHSNNGITFLQMVPSIFLRWSQEQIAQLLIQSQLRILAFGGECFPQNILKFPRSAFLRVFNLYGITEVSCWASVYEVPTHKIDVVPLGKALDETILEIRDHLNQKVMQGEGEVFILSSTRICWTDNENKTDQNFVIRATGDIAVINSNGIFYKGRKNNIHKRFGHKLDLLEIEKLIEQSTNLNNKCVWLDSEAKLLIFFILEDFNINSKNQMLDKIRVKLLHSLPKPSLPDYLDIVRKCPTTSHGKIDVEALKSLYYIHKETANLLSESIFKVLVCKYCGLSQDELKENCNSTFFEIGGNSILAIQLLQEFSENIRCDCSDLTTALFEKDLESCFNLATTYVVSKKVYTDRKSSEITNKIHVTKLQNLNLVWSYDLGACVDATPLVFNFRNRILVAVGSYSHTFIVLDADTGSLVSKFILPDVIESTPCFSPENSVLFIGCFDGCLYALNFISNNTEWVYTTEEQIKCTPVLCHKSSAIVFGSYDKFIHCVRSENGQQIWKTFVEESISSTPLVYEGKIYVASIYGTCFCISEDNGKIFWKYGNKAPIFGGPCLTNDLIVWPVVHGLIIFLTLDGKKMYEFKSNGHVYSSLVCHRDKIIFGSHDHNLYVLKINDNNVETDCVLNLDDCLNTPCLTENLIAISSISGNIFLINLELRAVVGKFDLPNKSFSSVVSYMNRFFIGCRSNSLYCIEK